MMTQETVAARLERVRERIAAAAARAGRDPADITLIGASKTVEPARVAAAVAAGLRDLGENYVQEAQAKIAALERLSPPPAPNADPASGATLAAPSPLRWHLIGHLQSNKAKTAVELFDIIQTLDSARLAAALARHATLRGCHATVLVEVDYTGLPDRTGLRPDAVYPTVEAVLGLPAIELVGLMTVPAPGLSADETRAVYRRLGRLREQLSLRFPEVNWQHLSMGMTDDFELAIEEGATMVRIGRAIFGDRP